MKTITLVAFNRPSYTKQALAALSDCRSLETFDRAAIFIEPGCDEVVTLCEAWAQRQPIAVEVHINPVRLGVAGNPLRAYTHVFEVLGSDFNVAIEDDAVLSPDALELSLWFEQRHTGADSRYSFLNLCDHYDYRGKGRNRNGAHDDPALIAETINISSPFAWCFGALQWPFIKNNWDKNIRSIGGWDWSIRFAMRMEGKIALAPVVSRCQNIGEFDGTFETGSTFWVQRGLRYSDGSYRGEYRIVNQVTEAESRTLARWMIPEIPRYLAERRARTAEES